MKFLMFQEHFCEQQGLGPPGFELIVTGGARDHGLILNSGFIQSFKTILYSVCIIYFFKTVIDHLISQDHKILMKAVINWLVFGPVSFQRDFFSSFLFRLT